MFLCTGDAVLPRLRTITGRLTPPDIRRDVLSDAVFAAARNGHTEVVEYLLEHGAQVDAKGVFGATGLHWAAINGHRKTVELLIAVAPASRFGMNVLMERRRVGPTRVVIRIWRISSAQVDVVEGDANDGESEPGAEKFKWFQDIGVQVVNERQCRY